MSDVAQFLVASQMTEEEIAREIARRSIVRWLLVLLATFGVVVMSLTLAAVAIENRQTANLGLFAVAIVFFSLLAYNSAKNLARTLHPDK